MNVIFLVHGNHGSSKDLIPLEKELLSLFSTSKLTKIFRSSCNELDTEIGIMKGGSNLADEIIQRLEEISPKTN